MTGYQKSHWLNNAGSCKVWKDHRKGMKSTKTVLSCTCWLQWVGGLDRAYCVSFRGSRWIRNNKLTKYVNLELSAGRAGLWEERRGLRWRHTGVLRLLPASVRVRRIILLFYRPWRTTEWRSLYKARSWFIINYGGRL